MSVYYMSILSLFLLIVIIVIFLSLLIFRGRSSIRSSKAGKLLKKNRDLLKYLSEESEITDEEIIDRLKKIEDIIEVDGLITGGQQHFYGNGGGDADSFHLDLLYHSFLLRM